MDSTLKKKLLQCIIKLIREQDKKINSLNTALLDYTGFDVDGFTGYTKRQRDILEIILGEYFVEDVMKYISDGKYYILDWDRLEKEGKKGCVKSDRDEYAIKIITDDDEFIDHILDISNEDASS